MAFASYSAKMLSRSTLVREVTRRLPNAMILVLLAGLGIWGHRHHWQMPRVSELTSQIARRDVSPPTRASPTANVVPTVQSREGSPAGRSKALADGHQTPDRDHSPVMEVDRLNGQSALPIINFRSGESVLKSGIRAAPAEEKELDEFVLANGVVEYDETHLAQLASRAPGIAWRVYKNVGDSVAKDEVLAILDSTDVGKVKAELLEAVVTFNLKAETLRRYDRSRSSIPERTIREAEADEKVAYVHQFNARQSLINLGLPVPSDWESEMSVEERAMKIQFLGIPKSLIASFGKEVVTANLIPLTAPFDGVVIDREIVTGEVVQSGHPQFVIADVTRMWLKLNVRKADVARLAIGQRIWFSSDGIPGDVESRLSWIATEVDEKTRTVQVRAEAENPRLASITGGHDGQRLLRAHTFGTGRIRVRDERRTIVVPSNAIQAYRGNYLVFVPQPDGRSFQPRSVIPGVARDDHTEIIRGVRAGELVVTTGSYVLKAEAERIQGALQVSQP